MLKLAGIAVPLDDEAQARGGVDVRDGVLVREASKCLGIAKDQIDHVRLIRRSVDARRKSNVHFVATVAVSLKDEQMEQRLAARGAEWHKPYRALDIPQATEDFGPAPVVVGTGPAGLFAALYLARAGMRPIVLERGASVDQRAHDVAQLNETGQLNVHSNIQFGEGGAGTFSDGKLTTNIKSPFAPHVLRWFADAGAPEQILWQAKPHIGSDLLPAVVASMRNEIVERGGVMRFNAQLTGLDFEGERLAGIQISNVRTGEIEQLACEQLVLACGHSARDTFSLLQRAGIHLEQKPFSVGVRIEHEQAAVNRSQWGKAAQHPALGAADYKLAVHGCAGRSVYTFCMCPGGEVVCAASEEEGVVTNGASPFARDGRLANSALLVNAVPGDFEGADRHSADPLAGARFQRQIEQRAYQAVLAAGGAPYQVPAQTVADFLADKTGAVPDTSCTRGVVSCNLRTILPAFACDAIASALPLLDRKLSGFAADNAVLLAPETRSTSPVRIARNNNLQAWVDGCPRDEGCGIYPAGEGAGYAGGIMSAACDGLRVATQLAASACKD